MASSSHQASASASGPSAADKCYTFDARALASLQSNKPWMADAKFFKTVLISPSCAAKMLMHAQAGVEKGMAKVVKQVRKDIEILDKDVKAQRREHDT